MKSAVNATRAARASVSSYGAMAAIFSFMFAILMLPQVSANAAESGTSKHPGVALYERICLAAMPDTSAVEGLARDEKWSALSKAEVDALALTIKPDVLHTWQGNQFGEKFSVVVTENSADSEIIKLFPRIAGRRQNGCSVLLPHSADIAQISQNMADMIGRGHDRVEQAGNVSVLQWFSESDEILVILQVMYSETGEGKRVMGATFWPKTAP